LIFNPIYWVLSLEPRVLTLGDYNVTI